MFLHSGKEIAEKIQFLIDGAGNAPVRLAVAFWGRGANYELRGTSQIICDVESGACDPTVIRGLRDHHGFTVLKLSKLHAKVVIGSGGAVVSSANMSTNGLGSKIDSASGTFEAGIYVPAEHPDYIGIVKWFEHVWGMASKISNQDLEKAQEKWNLRNREVYTGGPSELACLTTTIDPYSLLDRKIEADHRIRSVKQDLLARFKEVLPNVDQHRLGKIASWACHLILNRAGVVLDYSAGVKEAPGQATDQWIVKRFGRQKKVETAASVERLLEFISRDPFFLPEVRCAANQVLSVRPWKEGDFPKDKS
jgi:hypothetical protein